MSDTPFVDGVIWTLRRNYLIGTPPSFDLTAEEFRMMLKLCGFSQRRFAELTGRSNQIVSLWACGHESVPRYAAAFLVCFARLSREDQDFIRDVLA